LLLAHDLFGKPVSTFPDHALMNDRNYRDEIVRLEEQIDELAARIESCRKFILAGRIVVIGGGAVLVAILIGAFPFNPSVMAVAVAAMLGGIVAAGSNHGTAKEALHELTAAEAKRAALIGHIDLRLVSDRDGAQ
jgi:hypothetical protein